AFPERLFARPAFGQQGRPRQQRAYGFALLRRVRQGGEVEFAEGGRGRLFPDLLLRRPFRLFQQTRRFHLTPASEVRVSDHQRPTLTLSCHLQSQQVTPTRQIAYRVTLDQIPRSLINERRKRDEVERPFGRDEQSGQVPEQRAQRLKYFQIHDAGQ